MPLHRGRLLCRLQHPCHNAGDDYRDHGGHSAHDEARHDLAHEELVLLLILGDGVTDLDGDEVGGGEAEHLAEADAEGHGLVAHYLPRGQHLHHQEDGDDGDGEHHDKREDELHKIGEGYIAQRGDDGREDDHVDEAAGLALLQQVLRHDANLGEDDAEDKAEDGVVDAGELAQPHAQQSAGHGQQDADVVGVIAVELLGELDAIICRDHPHADPKTGAAHCCGHHVQLANMLAVGMAFKDAGIMDELDGDLMLFAVPAEEYVEIDFRNGLREKGDLRYLGGKQQLIAEGAFDGIDIAMQMHANITNDPHGFYDLGGSCNGFVGKLMTYRGRAAHAAGAPDKGINALNAAMMGVMGVNAIRERFREDDFVRFHPIINSGGDLVNVIPDYVTMESYTRAANVDALLRYNTDINRALRAGADAVGATCELQDLPGYLPLRPDENLRNVLRDNAVALFGEEHVAVGAHNAGSTEMGDVSHLIPVVHPWVGCAKGVLHGANFVLDNEEVAYEKSPEVLAMTIIDLLYDDAKKAEEICANFKPVFTKETYCEFQDKIASGQ